MEGLLMLNYYKEIYLQPKEKVYIDPNAPLIVGDVCEISGEDTLVDQIKKIEIFNGPYINTIFVITLLQIIKNIINRFPEVKINILSERDVLIEVKKQQYNKLLYFLKMFLVCILLFIGAGTAIMNFHADVNMDVVQRNFYEFITGNRVNNPLWISIPYSIGIGIGMFLFFNHISLKDRKSNKPSPLDLELNSYQTTIDDYIRTKSKEGKN